MINNKNQDNNYTVNPNASSPSLLKETQEADLLWQEYQSISKSKKIAKKVFYTTLIFILFTLIILGVYIVFNASNPF